jgi:hypothetical protein
MYMTTAGHKGVNIHDESVPGGNAQKNRKPHGAAAPGDIFRPGSGQDEITLSDMAAV